MANATSPTKKWATAARDEAARRRRAEAEAMSRGWDAVPQRFRPVLAAIVGGLSPWASYAPLEAEHGAEVLEDAYRAGYLDGWFGVVDDEEEADDQAEASQLVTLSPWGARQIGVMLVEHLEARPRWEGVACDARGLWTDPALVAQRHERQVPMPRPELLVAPPEPTPDFLLDPVSEEPVRLFAGEAGKGGIPVVRSRRQLRGKGAPRPAKAPRASKPAGRRRRALTDAELLEALAG